MILYNMKKKKRLNGMEEKYYIHNFHLIFFGMDCPAQAVCSTQIVIIVSLLLSNLLQLRAMATPCHGSENATIISIQRNRSKKKSLPRCAIDRLRTHVEPAKYACWSFYPFPKIGSVNDD